MRSTGTPARLARVAIAAIPALFSVASAGASESARMIVGDSLAIVVDQKGEERCFLSADYIRDEMAKALQAHCDIEITGSGRTVGRSYLTMRWAFGSMITGMGATQVNVCTSPYVVQFGRFMPAAGIESDITDGSKVFVETLAWQGSFAHQMSVLTKNHIYDSLPPVFNDYARSLCSD